MSNLMIDSPATQYSPLTQRTRVYKPQTTPLLGQARHSPFLTSEVGVPKNVLTAEQELTDYIQHAYPRTRNQW